MRTRLWLFGFALFFGCGHQDQPVGWTLEDLSPSEGFTIKLPAFTVPYGHESQRCWFMRVPDVNNGGDVWIGRVKVANNPGTHHVNVFRVRTIKGLGPDMGVPVKIGPYDGTLVDGSDEFSYKMNGNPANPCWDSSNWADWPFVANSQNSEINNPYVDWTLPDKVALRMTPGEWIMIQTHYVNLDKQRTDYGAKTGINFYSFPGKDPIEMGTQFATQQNIRICQSRPSVTYSGTCHFPDGSVTVAAANGHFHKRGVSFKIYTWDGLGDTHPSDSVKFYESDDWNNPPMMTGLDVKPPANGGVWWDCQYQWRAPDSGCDAVNAKDPQHQDDCCYTFGGNTDVGEHCNVFVYYYPSLGTNVFCN